MSVNCCALFRLLAYLDVAAANLNRFRQRSFGFDSSVSRSEVWKQLLPEYNAIKRRLFPPEETAPQYTSAALGDAAVAELAQCGQLNAVSKIRDADNLLTDFGWLLTPTPGNSDSHRVAEQREKEIEPLTRYLSVRRHLLAVLAQLGIAVPTNIRLRQHIAFDQHGNVSDETLLDWLNNPGPESTRTEGLKPNDSVSQKIEGGTESPQPNSAKSRKGMSKNEAEIAVREWLRANAPINPSLVTRDGIAKALGCSGSTVSETSAWKVFAAARKANKSASGREVQLTDGILAVLPDESDVDSQDELDDLIDAQKADARRDGRNPPLRRRKED